MQPLDSDLRPSYDDIQVSISRTVSLFVLLSHELYPNTAGPVPRGICLSMSVQSLLPKKYDNRGSEWHVLRNHGLILPGYSDMICYRAQNLPAATKPRIGPLPAVHTLVSGNL